MILYSLLHTGLDIQCIIITRYVIICLPIHICFTISFVTWWILLKSPVNTLCCTGRDAMTFSWSMLKYRPTPTAMIFTPLCLRSREGIWTPSLDLEGEMKNEWIKEFASKEEWKEGWKDGGKDGRKKGRMEGRREGREKIQKELLMHETSSASPSICNNN